MVTIKMAHSHDSAGLYFGAVAAQANPLERVGRLMPASTIDYAPPVAGTQ